MSQALLNSELDSEAQMEAPSDIGNAQKTNEETGPSGDTLADGNLRSISPTLEAIVEGYDFSRPATPAGDPASKDSDVSAYDFEAGRKLLADTRGAYDPRSPALTGEVQYVCFWQPSYTGNSSLPKNTCWDFTSITKAKREDPDMLGSFIGNPIEAGDYVAIGVAMRDRIAYLHKCRTYYEDGEWNNVYRQQDEMAKSKTVLIILQVEFEQAGSRAGKGMGVGWAMLAYYAGLLLRWIQMRYNVEPRCEPTSWERDEDPEPADILNDLNWDDLFNVGIDQLFPDTACFICLSDEHTSKHCERKESERPIIPTDYFSLELSLTGPKKVSTDDKTTRAAKEKKTKSPKVTKKPKESKDTGTKQTKKSSTDKGMEKGARPGT
jgi:hypothetical protein